MTKLEKKTGSPEKPLSALGQMTYKSYWHSAILSKLDEYRRLQMNVTVTQLRFENKLFFFLLRNYSTFNLALTLVFVLKMLFKR